MLSRLLASALVIAAPLTGPQAGAPKPASPAASTAAPTGSPGGAPAAKDPAKARAEASASSVSVRVRVPLADDRFGSVPVATVDEELVTVDDLRDLAAVTHEDRKEGKTGKTDFMKLVDRLIAVKTVVAEAKAIGLDELDEVKKASADNLQRIRFDLVRKHATRDVKPDAAEVERRYAAAAREWRIRSVLFAKEADAKKFVQAVGAGGDYEALAKKAVADKLARSGEGAQWLRATNLQPEIVKALEKLAVGKVSPALKIPQGWTVVRLEEPVRPVKDDALRAKLEGEVHAEALGKALEAYYAGLKKQRVQVDRKLLASVDFNAPKGGFDALRKDRRVVARIQGAEPVTISELADAVSRPLFHGVAPAQEQKKLDKQKKDALESLVSKRLVVVEAERLRLDDTPEAKRQLDEFETNILFSTFIDKVVIPEIKVTEEQERAEYDRRRDEFKYPAFYRLEGLAFADAKNAQAALKSLQSGTDFNWLRSNSDGLLPEAKQKFRLDPAIPVSAGGMPKEFRTALAGTQGGDVRLVDSGGQQYVLKVLEITPEQARPFEEVRADLNKELFAKEVGRGLDAWVPKLREAHEVHVYLETAP